MRPTTTLHIPQPCAESWDAMSPTATGRHCAACAKTVVDFTTKTDAQILAYLAGAAGGRTCGRFAAGQLERPLQRAVPAAPSGRWRAWLAALAAIWAVREGVGTEVQAQARTEWRARYWGGPVPVAPVADVVPLGETVRSAVLAQPPTPSVNQETLHGVPIIRAYLEQLPLLAEPPLVLRGIITDVATGQGLPGVTVLIKGTSIGTSTNPDGAYEIQVPAEMAKAPDVCITVSSVGYLMQERVLAPKATEAKHDFCMQVHQLGGLVVVSPAPWHPRAFYNWGKYWLTRPFRRN